jgi:hypothetical protein
MVTQLITASTMFIVPRPVHIRLILCNIVPPIGTALSLAFQTAPTPPRTVSGFANNICAKQLTQAT